MLWHADRLGIGHDRGLEAPDEQSVTEAFARSNSRSARAPRILTAGPDAGQALSRVCWRSFIAASAEEWGIAVSWSDCATYGQSVRNWPAFADTAASLQYLKQHYKLAILSNVDNESFSFSNEKLGVDFDAVYTAEDCGSYKPSPRNFDYMLAKLKTLGIEKSEILHTAESLFHDHGPANEHGLASCWIHRRHGQEGSGATMALAKTPSYDFRFESLGDFVKAHQEALKA